MTHLQWFLRSLTVLAVVAVVLVVVGAWIQRDDHNSDESRRRPGGGME